MFGVWANDGDFLERAAEGAAQGKEAGGILEEDNGVGCRRAEELSELRGVDSFFGAIKWNAGGVRVLEETEDL